VPTNAGHEAAADPLGRAGAALGREAAAALAPEDLSLWQVRSNSATDELRQRLGALSVERLAGILLQLVECQGEPLRRLVEAALRAQAEAKAPAVTEDVEPFLIGNSPAMQRVFDAIRKFAASDAPVLVSGESGTGKELVARAIHERSAYGSGPFVPINCAALPATLIAAELFGHEKGAFTGASQRRIGRLELAQGGTILLDEIGDLPLELQGHLLRFLQEGVIDRVGGRRPVKIDARVICATNSDLGRAMGSGRFREDLYYRLNVLSVHLPSLRERGDDIELLATFFLRKLAKDHGRVVTGFTADGLARVRQHSWPGNVRELIAAIRRALVMTESVAIAARDLALDQSPPCAPRPAPVAVPSPARVGAEELRAALTRNGGNVTGTARELDVSRMTVYRLMRRFGVR